MNRLLAIVVGRIANPSSHSNGRISNPSYGTGASILTFLAILVVPAAALAAAPDSSGLGWTQKVQAEEQRQKHVANRVDDVTGRFRALIKDLESNGFIEKDHSEELLAAIEVLDKVNEQNVRQAITSLRAARDKPAAALTHLAKADGEIEIVVNDLLDLLKMAKATEAGQLLREELRRIIRQEETLWAKTKQLGRAQLEGQEIAAAELADLAAAQSEVALLAVKLRTMFPTAVEDAVDAAERSRIEKAGEMFGERQIEALLNNAAQNIELLELVEAVGQQEEALIALRLVQKLLGGEARRATDNLTALLAKLRQLLEKQQTLRAQTEAAEPPKFTTQRRQFQGAQRELHNELSQIDASVFAPSKFVGAAAAETNPITDADQAMADAESSLDGAKQKEAVTYQRAVEAALERAIELLEKQIAAAAAARDAANDPIAQKKNLVALLKRLEEEQRQLREATHARAHNNQSVTPHVKPQQDIMDETLPIVQMPEAEALVVQKALGKALFGMEDAGRALKEDIAAEAVPAQIRAEEGLAEARRAIEVEVADMEEDAKKDAALTDAQKAAEALIKEQKPITAETKEAPPQDAQAMADKQAAVADKQEALAVKTEEAAQESPPEVDQDLQQAAKAMKAAAKAIQKGDKDEAAEEQAKAEKALKSAAAKAAKSKNSKASNNKKDKGKRGGKMKGKGKSKGAKGAGKNSKGEGEGGDPSPGPPSTKKGAPKMAKGSEKNIDAKGGERLFAKTGVSGKLSDDTTSDWQVLGSRDQEVVTERYIQQLPVEYREMLKDYYQALSDE